MSAEADWVNIVRELGPAFAERAPAHDVTESFVAANYVAMKERKLFAAGVPSELGGGGASHAEMCAVIREIGHHCGSTALAVSMYTHIVATMSYTWRSGNKAPEGMLKRVAAEGLVLMTSGGADWLHGSGKLEKVDGRFKLTGRKIFGSGGPAADVLMTMGIYDDPTDGPVIIHFAVPVS